MTGAGAATVAPERTDPPPPDDGRRAGRAWAPGMVTLFTLGFAGAGWCAGLVRLSDNSFFWHLRTGHLILDSGGVPREDVYSYTAPGTKWIAQSWLAELLYGVVDDLFGSLGLRVLTAVIGATIGVLVYRLALRIAIDRVRAAAIAVPAFLSILVVWSTRPLLIGLVAFLVLVWAVELPDSVVGRHLLVSVPVLMWVWANVHGTFSLGFVFLALHLLGRWFEGERPWDGRSRELLLGSLVAAGVLVLNPYGVDLLLFPLQLLGRSEVLDGVKEWVSPSFRQPGGMLFGLWLVVFVVALAAGKRAGRRDLLVGIVFVALSMWAQRNIGLTTIVTLPIVARAFAAERPRAESRIPLNWVVAATLLLFPITWTALRVSEPDYSFRQYPVAALEEVDRRGWLDEHIFTSDGTAGYMILQYWPEARVFMDDRFDMYPLDVNDDYDTLAGARPEWREVLDRRGVNVVVWPTRSGLSQVLEENAEWTRVFDDDVAEYSVFARDALVTESE
jgi:hypothetical protein